MIAEIQRKKKKLNETNFSISYGFLYLSRDSCAMEKRRKKNREALKAKQFGQMLASRVTVTVAVCVCMFVCDSVCSIHTENDYYGSYCIMNEQASKRTNIIQIQRHTSNTKFYALKRSK